METHRRDAAVQAIRGKHPRPGLVSAGAGLRCLILPAALAGAALLGQAGARAVHRLQAPPPLAPWVRIPVEPLGFRAPSRFYLSYRVPSATLDFVDDSHLLFTFHQSILMRREPNEPADDEDQTMGAALLDLPSGKVVERADWRLHDKDRYLWPLGHGRFLERERNTLYLLDPAAAGGLLAGRTPYFKPEGDLVSVDLSPDHSSLLVEYRESEDPSKDSADTNSASPDSSQVQAASLGPPTLGDLPVHRRHPVRLLVIDTQANKVVKSSVLAHALSLPLLADGYLDVEQVGDRKWKLLLTPFGGAPRKITEVTSLCQPILDTLTERVLIAQLCIPNTGDHLVQAWEIDGHKLWEQQWESRYVWGSFVAAENGSRFAYESIQLDHPIGALDPVDEESITGQPVGVYDLADGALRLVKGADPILSAGQNFALSSDGERFAVLRGGAIEVYKLPPAPVR